MTFPFLNSVDRTDEAFLGQDDEEHHLGPHGFVGLDVGLVSQFPLDYMHLKFCGVVFTEENTVNLVASNWYVDGKCWWPNYATDDKISKAIRRFEEPGPGWRSYSARLIFERDDFIEATQKLKEYLNNGTAGLQSEAEDQPRKRKRREKKPLTVRH
ncbi:hypothetical protein NQZ68_029045 [Dissostichus eleginoides]|nr:hypothetical protein NQZ68_029045 [Dissostichus eleginoides]